MEALQSTVVPALLVQNVAAPATNNATFPDQVTRTVDPTIPPTSTNSNSTRTADLKGKRVTLAYDGLAAPTLDIRFSSQAFPDANLLIRRLGKHSPSASTDGSHSHSGNSHPGISRSKTTVGIATVVPSVSPFADPAVDYPFPLPKTGRGRSRSLSQKSSTPGSGPELHNPFADSYEILFPRGAGILSPGGSAEDGSMEGSLMAIHQLSKKFPGLPPGVVPVRPEELFANGGGGGRRRSKSMSNAAVGVAKRKPPPPVLVEESETMSTTKSTRSPTLVQQQQGRLTKSRPRSRSQPPAPIPNRTTGSNRYSDEMVQMDDELGNASRPAGQLSPTASLDQDVATRTRRRIRNHLSTIEPASASARSSAAGITGDNETQWAMVPQPSTLNGVATRERTKSSDSLQNRTVPQ
ncbi:hypothetical protein FRC17_002174 [Serendipita sp. 399]|nr:hypothetical protein FRC17_002174 [Serendipita sp. 399]